MVYCFTVQPHEKFILLVTTNWMGVALPILLISNTMVEYLLVSMIWLFILLFNLILRVPRSCILLFCRVKVLRCVVLSFLFRFCFSLILFLPLMNLSLLILSSWLMGLRILFLLAKLMTWLIIVLLILNPLVSPPGWVLNRKSCVYTKVLMSRVLWSTTLILKSGNVFNAVQNFGVKNSRLCAVIISFTSTMVFFFLDGILLQVFFFAVRLAMSLLLLVHAPGYERKGGRTIFRVRFCSEDYSWLHGWKLNLKINSCKKLSKETQITNQAMRINKTQLSQNLLDVLCYHHR